MELVIDANILFAGLPVPSHLPILFLKGMVQV